MHFTSLASLAALASVSESLPTRDVKGGDITLNAFQLYPENGDVDPETGRAYFSVLYNASVAVYDPASNTFAAPIEFPPLTMDPVFHASGIDVDAAAGQLSVMVNAGVAFDTDGANVTGDNFLYKLNLRGDSPHSVLWRANLTAATDGAVGGCQDAAVDSSGNTFVACSYPGAILRVTSDGGSVKPWFLSNYTAPGAAKIEAGISGVQALDDDVLLAADSQSRKLVRFDMNAAAGVPVEVPIVEGYDNGTTWEGLDGIYMPERWGGRVLLVSSNTQGTNVLVSDDEWATARQVGFVAKPSDEAFSVATMQMGERVYSVNEFFGDAAQPKVPGTVAGSRSEFPLQDITEAVDAMVKKDWEQQGEEFDKQQQPQDGAACRAV